MAVVFERPKSLCDVPTHYCPGCTHGIVHRTEEELIYDVNLLKKYDMYDCIYITEIGNEDYIKRENQIREILTLKKYIDNN